MRRSPFPAFLLAALLVIGGAVAAAFRWDVAPWLAALAGLNLAVLLLYAYDKAVAGGTSTRVPENLLHLLALLGGSPAALLGQRLFRHKTSKVSFQRATWLIVALQAAAVGAWFWRFRL